MDEHPSPFTFAGRLVILIAIVIGVGGTGAYFWWIHDSLIGGSYPLIVFAFPAFFGAWIFVMASFWVMRFFGIPFFKEDKND